MDRAGDTRQPTTTAPPATTESPAPTPPGPVPGADSPVGNGHVPVPLTRRLLRDEVWIVLGLTFLASATFAVLDLVSRPRLAGTTAVLYQPGASSPAYQILSIFFSLVPVLLVVHLLHRSGETAGDIGLSLRPRSLLRRDLRWGLGLFALVGGVGLAFYLAAVALGANRDVVVIAGDADWWAVPMWIGRSLRYGLTEEIIVAGYLLHRLDQLGWSSRRALAASSLLRGTYHLYQGIGGFAGNLAMGVLFGRIYQRTGRTVPLVVAHVLLDVVAGLGYLALRNRVGWLAGS